MTCHGSAAACSLEGCPVVATELVGVALLDFMKGRSVLDAIELQCLVHDVLTAILHLQV
jgi:hypothetical protein